MKIEQKSTPSKVKWLWGFWKNHVPRMILLVILSFLNAAILVVNPYIFKIVIDGLQQEFTLEKLKFYSLLMLGAGAGTLVVYLTMQSNRAWMNILLEWRFRQRTFEYICRLGLDFFNKFHTGDIITRLTDDIPNKLAWFSCSGIFRLLEASLVILFGLGAMLSLNPYLTIFAAGPLPLLVFLHMITHNILYSRFNHLQKTISEVSDTMEACFSGIRVIKAYCREHGQQEKFKEIITNRKKAEVSAAKAHNIIHSMYGRTWQLAIALVLLVGGKMVISGSISTGTLVAFMGYVSMLVFPMFDVAAFIVRGKQSYVSIERLMELEDWQPLVKEAPKPVVLQSPKGEVNFTKVHFSYNGNKVLNGINFELKPGCMIALAGKVGCGKSTITKLLLRLMDSTEGQIKLDGQDIKTLSLDSLRTCIGYVPQEPILFSDTIENNIIFGRPNLSSEAVKWLSEIAQLTEELDKFPNGLSTAVGQRGLTLSGGQKQRVAIARAIVTKPRILILDDCTSALDAKTEAALWDELYRVMPDISTLVISHRCATMQRANQILVLDDGCIAEAGTHDQLISYNSLYRKLYQQQLVMNGWSCK